MGAIKDTFRAIGNVLDAMAEHQKEVTNLTDKLMQKTYGVDRDQAEKIARVLITQAEINWK